MSLILMHCFEFLNPISAKFIKRSNTLKQFDDKLPMNRLSVFDHFAGLALKGLNIVLRSHLCKLMRIRDEFAKVSRFFHKRSHLHANKLFRIGSKFHQSGTISIRNS